MSGRDHCYRCDKVQSLCLCERVALVRNRHPVTIVQHRLERRHPFGTVRIARLGLERVEVQVARGPGDALTIPPDAAVLFPDRDAPVLSDLPVLERPRHLVVIDGTWSQASQLRRVHPALAGLPAVRLARGAASRYRIRREPNVEAVSTIEAIVRALAVLEPETEGLEGLLASFEAMIDDQLVRRAEQIGTPRRRHKPRLEKPLPEVLRCDRGDVVLLYAELHQPRGQRARFPLRVTAARPCSSRSGWPRQLVDALVPSPIPPSPSRWKNMELCEDLPVLDREALTAELRALVRPTDTIVAWPQSPEGLLRELGLTQPFLSAKHYFANLSDGPVGALEEVIERLDGEPVRPWAPGRAGRQLAQLDRVVREIRARAR